jgi:hypothetical protein
MKYPFLCQENSQTAGKPIGKQISEQNKKTHTCAQLVTYRCNKEEALSL